MAGRLGNLLRYAFLLRWQGLALLFLVALPLVALRTPARAMLANFFVVTPLEAVWVSTLAVTLCWVAMVTTQLTFRLAELFGARRQDLPAWLTRVIAVAGPLRVPLFASLALPLLVGLVARSESLAVAAGAAVGTVVAWLLFFAASLLYSFLLPPDEPSSDLLLDLPLLRRVHGLRPWLPAAVERALRRLLGRFTPGHLLCLALLVCNFAVYLAVGLVFRPDGRLGDAFPALGYVLLLATLATWLLTGMAFWLDRYRVPTLAALLAVSFSGYFLSATDHYYGVAVTPTRLNCAEPAFSPSRAVQAWFEALPPGTPPRMTVVATSGGGITASAWTADVLTGLEAEIGPAFARSLTLISAVSGGSVGALYYLDRFSRAGGTEAGRAAIRAAASGSSLRQSAWGVVYPDLWRFLFAPLLRVSPELDRAWAAELAWRARLEERGASLRRWRAEILDGALPVPIFNATIVETGRLMLLSPVDLGGQKVFEPFASFQCLYPERDLALVTAARLSASFPFVSPIARPSDVVDGRYGRVRTQPGFHLADGGYTDNFGVSAVVAWLDAVLPTYQRLGGSEVLVIEIRGYDTRTARQARERAAPERGWVYALFGPLTTLLNVRSTSQSVHGAEEMRLLRLLWEARGVKFATVRFALDEDGPLSWQLAPEERERLAETWERRRSGRDLETVRAFFGDRPETPREPGEGVAEH